MFTVEELRSPKRKEMGKFWTPEMWYLAIFLYGYKPHLETIVEIGVRDGGSANLWRDFLDEDGTFIGIDINLYHPEEFVYAEMDKAVERFKDDKRMKFIIDDSGKEETKQKAIELLNGKGIDFLHIDGDHRECLRDFEMYSPLVNSGGVIAIHDATRNEDVRRAVAKIINVEDLADKDLPYESVIRFDVKNGHCGMLAMVKE